MRSSRKPLGRDDSEAVRQGNVLCGRAVILCILAAAKMMWWVLEQPQSSVMHLHPMFQYMIRLLGVHRLRVTMSSFGGPTKKGTHLYSRALIVWSSTNSPYEKMGQYCLLYMKSRHIMGPTMNLKAMNASKTSKSILYQSSWKIGTWLFPTTTLGGKNEFMVAKILNQASTTLTSGFVF